MQKVTLQFKSIYLDYVVLKREEFLKDTIENKQP